MTDCQSTPVFMTRKMTIAMIVSVFIVIIITNVKQIQPPPEQIATDLSRGVKTFPVPENSTAEMTPEKPSLTDLKRKVLLFHQLNLKLHGIVYKANNKGYAMLSRNGGIQEIYSANTEPLAGLTVKNINKKNVQFDYRGDLFTLGMSLTENHQGIAFSDFDAANFSSLSLLEQQGHINTDKKRNPIRLLMIRRPYEVFQSGVFLGYRVMPGANIDQFRRLGFERGDIITYLNGIAFDGPGKAAFVINELTQASAIDVTVLRGADELSINYGF